MVHLADVQRVQAWLQECVFHLVVLLIRPVWVQALAQKAAVFIHQLKMFLGLMEPMRQQRTLSSADIHATLDLVDRVAALIPAPQILSVVHHLLSAVQKMQSRIHSAKMYLGCLQVRNVALVATPLTVIQMQAQAATPPIVKFVIELLAKHFQHMEHLEPSV